jgi:hypothetical protein
MRTMSEWSFELAVATRAHAGIARLAADSIDSQPEALVCPAARKRRTGSDGVGQSRMTT